MKKGYYLLIFMLVTIFTYGQEINFQKNESYIARKHKLIQKLNVSGDSLILESERKKIKQVDILNEDYLESIIIDSTKGRINLKKLAIGNYVIQARIGRNWIVMYIEKTTGIYTSLNIKAELKEKSSEKEVFEEDKMYWVVYESNSQFSSQKTMGLKYVDEIQEMISKVKLELKTEDGKYNKLIVYEVYNKPMFMRRQLRNKKYYKSRKSKFFNTKPLYNLEIEIEDKS
ncbi:hypothetical protein [uncultured Winogradskyella sp.]|uniref:hypothetical protein n=1 Tax=uncultured Winogradskyella sp. TaxID=395353 RepID=UPI00261A7484|nr:hypothetical protein [uncultured Winogradskyella sp.]